LDRFELVAELATGGMATVYLARLSGVGGFQRLVAIKRLHPHLAREPEFIEMFLGEARLAARIHHPNVVPIIEISPSQRGYYIVMEYVEGDTLGRLLARSAQSATRLPMHVGVRILLDTMAGLDAAHELKDDKGGLLGIVHRDVSPQNVLVGVDGSSRLSDFGVARATSALSTTRSGQLKGKLAYMAPEQARGHKDVDRRADIFAAGIVLWEVLTCRRLFKGDGEADTLHRVLNDPIPPVRSVASTVPAPIEAVVAKALERDRAKRYETAAEFADALERASRVVGALGTHKDVALHLAAVLGTEMSAQREAVRAWLARSEPSRHAGDGSQGPESRSATSAMAVPSLTPPPSSSAIQGRGRVGPWVAVVAAVIAGGILGLAYTRGSPGTRQGASEAAVAASMAPPPATPSSPAGPAIPPEGSLGGTALSVSSPPSTPAPSGDSLAAKAIPSAHPAWRPSRPSAARVLEASQAGPALAPGRPATTTPTAAAPAASATNPPVPDDISRNPYR
jgi:serine/threonine-protein kinase